MHSPGQEAARRAAPAPRIAPPAGAASSARRSPQPPRPRHDPPAACRRVTTGFQATQHPLSHSTRDRAPVELLQAEKKKVPSVPALGLPPRQRRHRRRLPVTPLPPASCRHRLPQQPANCRAISCSPIGQSHALNNSPSYWL